MKMSKNEYVKALQEKVLGVSGLKIEQLPRDIGGCIWVLDKLQWDAPSIMKLLIGLAVEDIKTQDLVNAPTHYST